MSAARGGVGGAAAAGAASVAAATTSSRAAEGRLTDALRWQRTAGLRPWERSKIRALREFNRFEKERARGSVSPEPHHFLRLLSDLAAHGDHRRCLHVCHSCQHSLPASFLDAGYLRVMRALENAGAARSVVPFLLSLRRRRLAGAAASAANAGKMREPPPPPPSSTYVPSQHMYNFALGALGRCAAPRRDVEAVQRAMEADGVDADVATQTAEISALVRSSHARHARAAVQRAASVAQPTTTRARRRMAVAASAPQQLALSNARLQAHLRADDARGAVRLFEEMALRRERIDDVTYTLAVTAYGRVGQLNRAAALVERVRQREEALRRRRRQREERRPRGRTFGDDERNVRRQRLNRLYTALLAACARMGRLDDARAVFRAMNGRDGRGAEARADVVAFDVLFGAYAARGDVESFENLLHEMLEQCHLLPGRNTLQLAQTLKTNAARAARDARAAGAGGGEENDEQLEVAELLPRAERVLEMVKRRVSLRRARAHTRFMPSPLRAEHAAERGEDDRTLNEAAAGGDERGSSAGEGAEAVFEDRRGVAGEAHRSAFP